MLNRIVTIQANSETQIRGNTKRIIVRRADADFQVITDKEESAVVGQGDNFLFEKTASFIRLINLGDEPNRLVLVIASSGEGDLKATSGTVEIANVSEINGAASDYEIKNFDIVEAGVKVLDSGVLRRSAIISTSQAMVFSKVQGGVGFTVDGVLTHDAMGELWVSGPTGSSVEVIEYLI